MQQRGDVLDMIGYAERARDTLQERPFDAVDSLVLAQLAYLRYEGMLARADGDGTDGAPLLRVGALHTHPRRADLLEGVRAAEQNGALLRALAQSPRFADITARWYVDIFDPEAEKQFAAVTFLLPDGSAYIAFRGTDATMVGWKEDMNMSFMPVVPSQREAARYLSRVAGAHQGPLRVGGHSKGGNLAVYAASTMERAAQVRLLRAYSHDGPGFREEFLVSPGFGAVADRVDKTVPQSSVIGMLLQHQEGYRVVHSRQHGILQHDPFTWEIRDGAFVPVPIVTRSALYVDRTLSAWVASVDEASRAAFINAVFEVVRATRAQTVHDLTTDWLKNAGAVLQAARGMEPETKRLVWQTVRALFSVAARKLAPDRQGQAGDSRNETDTKPL